MTPKKDRKILLSPDALSTRRKTETARDEVSNDKQQHLEFARPTSLVINQLSKNDMKIPPKSGQAQNSSSRLSLNETNRESLAKARGHSSNRPSLDIDTIVTNMKQKSPDKLHSAIKSPINKEKTSGSTRESRLTKVGTPSRQSQNSPKLLAPEIVTAESIPRKSLYDYESVTIEYKVEDLIGTSPLQIKAPKLQPKPVKTPPSKAIVKAVDTLSSPKQRSAAEENTKHHIKMPNTNISELSSSKSKKFVKGKLTGKSSTLRTKRRRMKRVVIRKGIKESVKKKNEEEDSTTSESDTDSMSDSSESVDSTENVIEDMTSDAVQSTQQPEQQLSELDKESVDVHELHVHYEKRDIPPSEGQESHESSRPITSGSGQSFVSPLGSPQQRRKSLHHAYVTKVSHAQLASLANRTGAFTGPKDPYARFLLGAKGVRNAAKRALQLALQQTDSGQNDEILVGKHGGKNTLQARNPRFLDRIRAKHKETLKEETLGKVQKLEELRSYIVMHMRSLGTYEKSYEKLKADNERLREEHRTMVGDINLKVSETLKKNEESDQLIRKLQKEKIVSRRKLAREYAEFIKKCDMDLKVTQTKLEGTQKSYKDHCADLDNLQEFKTISFTDPEVIANRLVAEEKYRQQLLLGYQEKERLFKECFRQEEEDAEKSVIDNILRVLDEAKSEFTEFIDKRTATAVKENRRLQQEIEMQNQAQAQVRNAMEKEQTRNVALKKQRDTPYDERRNVLRYWDHMTCTPDMDISLNPSRASSGHQRTVKSII